jgi:hypothetical protein
MKTQMLINVTIMLVLAGITLKAQQPENPAIPYKSLESSVYGTDILIHANAAEDQRHAKIVIAPNGFLYAAWLISSGGYRIARSTDNGSTWTISALQGSSYYLNAVDIAVTGLDTNTLSVWAVSTGYMKNAIDIWDVNIEKFNQHMNHLSTVMIEQFFSNYGFPDAAIATDFAYPSIGASPFSIGIIYSKVMSLYGNTQVIFKTSADGGNTFTNTRTFASAGSFYINVALAFGRSQSLPEGRYFAAWDEQPNFSYYDSYFGKIFTAHTQSQFDGAWSAPYRLDTIGGGFNDGAKDPAIACQADQVNNSSNAFSVVVFYNKKLTASGNHTCVFGTGNLNAVAGAQWTSAFSSGTGTIRDMEPDVTYDPSHQKFYTTWSDSLNAKLKCSMNDMNLQAGGSWTLYSDGYNDGPNISNPFPKVKVNPVSQEVVNVWDSDLTAIRTNVAFDKSSLPVGITEQSPSVKLLFSVSPNPCRAMTKISFFMNREDMVSASLFDISGRQLWTIPPQDFTAGNHTIELNTSPLKPACYLIQVRCGSTAGTQQILVMP